MKKNHQSSKYVTKHSREMSKPRISPVLYSYNIHLNEPIKKFNLHKSYSIGNPFFPLHKIDLLSCGV